MLNLASTLDNLGQAYKQTGRLDLAEPLFLEALAIRERVLGGKHYGGRASRSSTWGVWLQNAEISRRQLILLGALSRFASR